MIRHKIDKLEWLTFEIFEECPRLKHGVFLRHGGKSSGAYDSLNFSTSRGDTPENVAANIQRAITVLGLSRYCGLWQEHGKRVVTAEVGKVERGDALTTKDLFLGLLIQHADCQAAILYDPIQHALSNVHCGWRGNVHNIYRETVEKMRTLYGSKPENLLVGISPSLGPHASEFINYARELPPSFYPFQVKPTYFNLWEISREQLLESGILPHHIEIAAICTYANPEDFFSYRRLKESGRHATIAALS